MYLPYKFKKLNIKLDPARLLDDLNSIPSSWWVTHIFDGTGHDVVPLISHDGQINNPDGTPNHSLLPPFLPTPYLQKLDYFTEVLNKFGPQPSRSRLMRVPANGVVKAHQDQNIHWNNKVRVHIPIVTDPSIHFHVWSESSLMREADHEFVHMQVGEAWVFNGWYFHSVTNNSPIARVHLVGDIEVTGKMWDLLFEGCTKAQIEDFQNFEYPDYNPDPETIKWATGGIAKNLDEFKNVSSQTTM